MSGKSLRNIMHFIRYNRFEGAQYVHSQASV